MINVKNSWVAISSLRSDNRALMKLVKQPTLIGRFFLSHKMLFSTGGQDLMKSNIEIIQDTFEQIVNQKKIDLWDQFFSTEYIARGAPYIGMGFSRDTSGNKHIINMIVPGSPSDGKLQVGDVLIWVEDEHRRWATYDEIEKGIRGSKYKVGVHRGNQTIEYELTRELLKGIDTHTDQAKLEMQEFMTTEFPDLRVSIKLILADGDMVVSLLEYRGIHAGFGREAVWREAWFVRLSEGKIVEGWPVIDLDTYFRQLGYQLIPPNS
jgi:predicted ester cyclase